MTEANSAQRKPATSEGNRRPRSMAELGIVSWTAIPNPVLEHWMTEAFTVKLRVMACVVRYSFGFRRLSCVIQDGRTLRPMLQADIARLLNLHKGSVTKAVQELVLERLVRLDGRQLYAIANPSEAPQPKILELPGQREIPEVADPEYLEEIEGARAEYSRTIQQARAVLRQGLEKAKRHYQARQAALGLPAVAIPATLPPTEELRIPALKVAGSATFELPDSQPVSLLKKRKKIYKKRKSGWVGEELVVGSSSAPPPDATPTHPLPSQEIEKALPTTLEVYDYLKQFTREIGKAPDLKIALKLQRRLCGASIEQLELLRQQRCQTGLVINSYGIFLNLADDVARSQEAFTNGAPTRPKSREEQQAEDYARRRRGERH
jgi:hypothetical protein